MQSAAEKLDKYLLDECVFHGSRFANLKTLIPNTPHDAGSDPRNKDTAIYATSNIPGAIIFSLIEGFVGTFCVNNKEEKTVAVFPVHFKETIAQNSGFVYVLSRVTSIPHI